MPKDVYYAYGGGGHGAYGDWTPSGNGRKKRKPFELCSGYHGGVCTEGDGWKWGSVDDPNFPVACRCGRPWARSKTAGAGSTAPGAKTAPTQDEEALWILAQRNEAVKAVFVATYPNSEKLHVATEPQEKAVPPLVSLSRNANKLSQLQSQYDATVVRLANLGQQTEECRQKAIKLNLQMRELQKITKASSHADLFPEEVSADFIKGHETDAEVIAKYDLLNKTQADGKAAIFKGLEEHKVQMRNLQEQFATLAAAKKPIKQVEEELGDAPKDTGGAVAPMDTSELPADSQVAKQEDAKIQAEKAKKLEIKRLQEMLEKQTDEESARHEAKQKSHG